MYTGFVFIADLFLRESQVQHIAKQLPRNTQL